MKRYLTLIILVYGIVGYSQKIIPPSPTASALGKYGDIPVSLYSGVPNISIPIYKIKSGDIELPISLSYHSSGNKVAEESSWVGLGWSLNAGGCITRNICGGDDFGGSGYIYEHALPAVGLDNSWKKDSIILTAGYYCNIAGTSVDGEPDVFNFNFNGYSGKFYFPKTDIRLQSLYVYPICEKATDLKIRYCIASKLWEIRDGKGFLYCFGTTETTNSYSASSAVPVVSETQVSQNEYSGEVISSWYLDKIVSPNGDSILFNYNKYGQYEAIDEFVYLKKQNPNGYYTKSQLSISENISMFLATDSYYGCPNNSSNYLYSRSQTFSHDVYLADIIWKEGRITFTTKDRLDMNKKYSYNLQPQRLDRIFVFNNQDNPVLAYSFNSSYFNCMDNDLKLRLDEVVEKSIGNVIGQKYKFDYYFGENELMPSKISAAVDHWGMYNSHFNTNEWGYRNQPNNMFVKRGTMIPTVNVINTIGVARPDTFTVFGADRSFNFDAAKLGMLKSIQYPTGGKDILTYEGNSYSNFTPYINKIEKDEQVNVLDDEDSIRHNKKIIFIGEDMDVVVERRIHYEGLIDVNLTQDDTGNKTGCVFNLPIGGNYATIKQVRDANGEILNKTIKTYSLETGKDYFDKNFYACDDNMWDPYYKETVNLKKGYYEIGVNTLSTSSGYNSYLLNIKYTIAKDTVINESGGGLRIKEIQKINKIDTVTVKYEYTYGAKKSSGKAMTRSSYVVAKTEVAMIENEVGGTSRECHVSKLEGFSNSFIPLGYSASGSPIGYDVVTEYVLKPSLNGRTSYFYKNEIEDIPLETKEGYGNYNIDLIFMPNFPTIPNLGNGLLLIKEIYNKDNLLLYREENTYNRDQSYTRLLKGARATSSHSCGIINVRFYDRYCEWWKLDYKLIKEYTASSMWNTMAVQYKYNPINLLPNSISKTSMSDGKIHKIETVFSCDLNQIEPYKSMYGDNMIEYPIESRTYLNDELVKSELNTFKLENGYKLPYETFNAELDKPLKSFLKFNGAKDLHYSDPEIKYTKYHGGNVVEYIDKSGMITTILWGYNSSYPIAEIKNIDYITVENLLGGYQNIKALEESLDTDVTKVDVLRTQLTSAQITTFSYLPLIGMITKTDSRGVKTQYVYDDFNRLNFIKDHNGNKKTKYDYHFSNE